MSAPAALPAAVEGGVLLPQDVEAARIAEAGRRAFIAENLSRARDPHQVGISSVGGCRRRVAYALSKTPVTDDTTAQESRAATLGTWEHTGYLPRLAAELPGATIETRVVARVAGLELVGHIDVDDPSTVLDLKTVGEWRLAGVRRMRVNPGSARVQIASFRRLVPAAYDNHVAQVGTYGLARYQAGRPPAFLGWYYLDRANGDEEIVVVPFTNAIAVAAVDRVTELVYWSGTPDEAPRDERGPGLSVVCDGCEWLKRCWGDDAVPGQTGAQRVHTDPEVEQALLDYDDARARESLAKQDKAYALARVEGNPYGAYGRASYGRNRSTLAEDPHAAARKLKRLGLAVPMTEKRGAVRVKLTPTPVTAVQPAGG